MIEFVEDLEDFTDKVNQSIDYYPSPEELSAACDALVKFRHELNKSQRIKSIICISYYCLENKYKPDLMKRCLDCACQELDESSLSLIIEDLRSMLVQIKNSQVSNEGRFKDQEMLALNSNKGFNFAEDKIRSDWHEGGGRRSIPLFFMVLSQLKHRDISSNLWWITPGILNLMDDTSDLEGIKLGGVVLLRQFLTQTIDLNDTVHFNFTNTGLAKVFEPILTSLWYHFPPSTDPQLTEKIWETVFTTLIPLYQVEYSQNRSLYYKSVSKFLSEIILQATLPRVATEYPELTLKVLKFVDTTIDILKERSVAHLQRLIYVLGEFLIRNGYITLFMPLVHQIVLTLTKLVVVCSRSRIVGHKYDLLACVTILSEKCFSEGTLDDETSAQFHAFVNLLKSKGCSWNQDERQLLNNSLSWGKFEL
ncbi:LANO_0B00936g1_1 [Lachancea nothofagi CBS 11611]|uniref:LANO_0B00936g1_1 n=1 Tax=Lachancea nothofagi CBS 11611 TaxID=1266666 RepID=A0A1G4IUS2_9SACH|nr:LANO_0B00936g1_1 [Lachancea nothofagi CBS 11611]